MRAPIGFSVESARLVLCEADSSCCRRPGAGLGDVLSSVNWAIEKDSGNGAEIVPIASVEAFLAAAELTEYKDKLDAEGIIVDDIAEVTDELLKDLGVSKIMHRKRFLRYAALMRPHAGDAAAKVTEAATEGESPPLQPWVIMKDYGKGVEVEFIPDLQKFMEVRHTPSPFSPKRVDAVAQDSRWPVFAVRLPSLWSIWTCSRPTVLLLKISRISPTRSWRNSGWRSSCTGSASCATLEKCTGSWRQT